MTRRDTRAHRAHRALKVLSIVSLSLIAWLIVALILLSWMPPMKTLEEQTALKPFRVHFEDGESLLTHAPDPLSARKKANQQRPGIIRKVKLDRSEAHG